MSTLMRDANAKLIGMILMNPNLLKNDVFKADYLKAPYDKMYKALKASHDQYNYVDAELLDTMADAETMLIDEVMLEIKDTSVNAYHALQSVLIDEWKKTQIINNADWLRTGKLTVDGFNKVMAMINAVKTPDLKALTSADINAFMRREDTAIKFTRFKKLNKCKINAHDFVVLAGGTGQGKTALALNLTLDLLEKYPVLYINIELSEDTIIKRLMASYTMTTMDDIDKRREMPSFKIDRMLQLNPFIDAHEMYLVTGSQTVETIQQLVSHMNQDKHFIVVIDHIGRISTNKDRYQAMTEISIAIRNLALDYNCTVLGLCQLNREGQREESPSSSMLRDSGEIEQSARKVMFIWQKEKGENLGLYMWFTKNDSAPLSQVRIKYDRECQRIDEVDDADIRTD